MSKVQLTISPDYVSDWTHVEAVRELFQNALDNQTTNKENEMFFEYSNGTLRVGNKKSVLTTDSLLLGSSTKRDDPSTIGKHGEGYKIAFMVLLRLGKPVTVYNYGAKEIWTTRLVKSRKFNGAMLLEVDVTKKAVFNTIPHHDLIISVDNITEQDYQDIINSNLHLQDNIEKYIADNDIGEVLLNPELKGKIFVNGLYVTSSEKFEYGYNVSPRFITLDRDRKLIDSIYLSFATSRIWRYVNKPDEVARLVMQEVFDVQHVNEAYVYGVSDNASVSDALSEALSSHFIEEHGKDAVPVRNNTELQRVVNSGAKVKAVMVNEQVAKMLSAKIKPPEEVTISAKKRLKKWFDSVSDKLSEEQIDEFDSIFEDILDY